MVPSAQTMRNVTEAFRESASSPSRGRAHVLGPVGRWRWGEMVKIGTKKMQWPAIPSGTRKHFSASFHGQCCLIFPPVGNEGCKCRVGFRNQGADSPGRRRLGVSAGMRSREGVSPEPTARSSPRPTPPPPPGPQTSARFRGALEGVVGQASAESPDPHPGRAPEQVQKMIPASAPLLRGACRHVHVHLQSLGPGRVGRDRTAIWP